MTPSAIEWRERMIARWSARAGELRLHGDALSHNKAAGLEGVIADLRQDLAAGTVVADAVQSAADVPSADTERLRQVLASSMPYRCSTLGIMFNDGPIMDAVRARLQARIDGCAYVPAIADTIADVAIEIVPPAEVVPFRIGPQISLFGEAA